MTKRKSILISGAGIAGSTLAYWLGRAGFIVTVVERDQGARSSGNPVDVRGEAVEVASEMGVMSRLTEAATGVRELRIVDGAGRVRATMDLTPRPRLSGGQEVEVSRSRLAVILLEAARDRAEFRFDESIEALHEDPDGVELEFSSGGRGRYDLVVGADGLHSNVRRLAFVPEAEAVRHLGLFVATVHLPGLAADPRVVLLYNTPGRSVAIHPGGGDPGAGFIFRAPMPAAVDLRDPQRQKEFLTETYSNGGWRVPELLERTRASEDLYFDGVSEVRLTRWSSGRAVLVGDAASCVSLFGEGSSMAMVGARTLARALEGVDEHTLAFRRYEATHRATSRPKQRGASVAAHILVPATQPGIVVRNLALRLTAAARGVTRAGR